jgi:2-polyprenyl-3-methyl-5-hydroxy-6-metoxy-1,4-benzoquinol methylase
LEENSTFTQWFDALYSRHTSSLRFAEVRRALQALTQVYVQRRDKMQSGAVFDGAGKRAAFGLFYTPLHFLTVEGIVAELQPPPAARVMDLGCGTGAGAAAWALAQAAPATVMGVDLNAWAVSEARWNWQALGVRGSASTQDATRMNFARCAAGDAIIACYTVNELTGPARDALLIRLLDAHARGASVLIVEPISKRIAPWWPAWTTAFATTGGREDTWRMRPVLPEKLALLDKAAGLDHRELTARSLFLPGTPTS